jgi:SAM-dependent methyltransferase
MRYDRADAQLYDAYTQGIEGDVGFYMEEAQSAGGEVLELACGTGRVLIPLAEAGVHVTGLDLSPSMLARAREKAARLPGDVRSRMDLVEGDMAGFSLGREFPLILIPFRSFQGLLTPEDQKKSLRCIRDHLARGGRLIVNIFDPRLAYVTAAMDPAHPVRALEQEFTHPVTGRKVRLWGVRHFDPVRQVLEQKNLFEEVAPDGTGRVILETPLVLRWTYRYEMEHLWNLCGFEIEALYGDFGRGPFRHGGEQIWVVRKA